MLDCWRKKSNIKIVIWNWYTFFVFVPIQPQLISYCSCVFCFLQLLLDCGLGGGGGSEGSTEAVVAQHRVLIFCQLKSMLDIVEHDLLKPKLPTVTYLRLDGSVQAGLRHSIVSRSVDGRENSILHTIWTGPELFMVLPDPGDVSCLWSYSFFLVWLFLSVTQV